MAADRPVLRIIDGGDLDRVGMSFLGVSADLPPDSWSAVTLLAIATPDPYDDEVSLLDLDAIYDATSSMASLLSRRLSEYGVRWEPLALKPVLMADSVNSELPRINITHRDGRFEIPVSERLATAVGTSGYADVTEDVTAILEQRVASILSGAREYTTGHGGWLLIKAGHQYTVHNAGYPLLGGRTKTVAEGQIDALSAGKTAEVPSRADLLPDDGAVELEDPLDEEHDQKRSPIVPARYQRLLRTLARSGEEFKPDEPVTNFRLEISECSVPLRIIQGSTDRFVIALKGEARISAPRLSTEPNSARLTLSAYGQNLGDEVVVFAPEASTIFLWDCRDVDMIGRFGFVSIFGDGAEFRVEQADYVRASLGNGVVVDVLATDEFEALFPSHAVRSAGTAAAHFIVGSTVYTLPVGVPRLDSGPTAKVVGTITPDGTVLEVSRDDRITVAGREMKEIGAAHPPLESHFPEL